MNGLYNALLAAVQTSFTGTLTAGNPVIGSPSVSTGLYLGMPVVGGTIPTGSVITALSPLTLSIAPTANGAAVSLLSGVLTASRRFQFPKDVTSQPAFFLRDGDEDLTYQGTVLQQQLIKAEIWLFSNLNTNPDSVPVTLLNYFLDMMQQAMAPDSPTNQYTIGGLVAWARMSGKVEKWPGDIDSQAIAVADVEIFVP